MSEKTLLSQKISSNMPRCLWCSSVEKLSRCGRCGIAYYCCRDHQVRHWEIHRDQCKKPQASEDSVSSSTDFVSNVNKKSKAELITQVAKVLQSTESQVLNTGNFSPNQCNLKSENISPILASSQIPASMFVPYETVNTSLRTENVNLSSNNVLIKAEPSGPSKPTSIQIICPIPSSSKPIAKSMDFFAKYDQEVFSANNEYLNSSHKLWKVPNENQEDISTNYNIAVSSVNQEKRSVVESYNLTSSDSAEKVVAEISSPGSVCNRSLSEICGNILHDLNQYGICVLDNFLGSELGDLIQKEVKEMFDMGIFKKGELVNSDSWRSRANIRSDVITWVDGTEPSCKYIGLLVKKLDVIMTTCNKMPGNGLLGHYKLNKRTKAMIACYPGDGTHYMKHVDNPHGDGRRITCIYYLNKNWNTKIHGGMLRIFPAGNDEAVASIEPIFDRMLLFWSDKRNPHEVLPSFAIRFAITVWYFDADERAQALKLSQT